MSRFNGHLSDEMLVRIARGEATGNDGTAPSDHLDACANCQSRLRDIRSMHALFTEAPAMDASDELLSAALQRRARQERVFLSHESTNVVAQSSGLARRLVPLAVAATVAIAAFALWPRTNAPTVAARATVVDSSTALKAPPPPASDSPLGALSPWPLVAYAQSASDVPEVPYPAITEFDTTAVKPGTRRYVRSSASSYHDYMPIDAEAIELRDTTYQGTRVWRVVTSSPFTASQHPRQDTAWIRRSDMRLVARRNESFAASIRQRLLPGDTVLEQSHVVHLPKELEQKTNPRFLRFSTRTPIRPGQLLVTDRSYFHLLVRSLPLHSTWRGSIDINLGQTRNLTPAIYEKTRSINVSVQGDSVVSTLWGNVPSWRVVLHTGPNPERWYVSKAGHEVLLVTGPFAMEWPRNRFDLIGRYVK
ncbi:hypothetical protein [Gemmatimonas sp.]|uniref:hypothetical protein n=1 Tax=Gemmatimonas sp. TaxID=1962908 RepID=UPI00286ABAD9|nr:hypothetical protein [Gemmatimonas sp.]